MEQTIIFDYIGFENDQVFQEIKHLEVNDSITLFNSVITHEEKGYVIENDIFHEAFLSAESCYQLLNKCINNIEE